MMLTRKPRTINSEQLEEFKLAYMPGRAPFNLSVSPHNPARETLATQEPSLPGQSASLHEEHPGLVIHPGLSNCLVQLRTSWVRIWPPIGFEVLAPCSSMLSSGYMRVPD